MSLSVAIPVRNKDLDILSGTFDTIEVARERAADKDIRIYVVDGGSDREYISDLRNLAYSHGFAYSEVKLDEWNKPRILNGILNSALTKWFACLDADYILEPEFFNKIMDNFKDRRFIQCRGYDRSVEQGAIDDTLTASLKHLDNNGDLFITNRDYEIRPEADFGGFQAFETIIGQQVGGYDEQFKWYGGMHHEMRERLLNFGLEELRCEGDPVMLHQPHPNWQDSKNGERLEEIKKERAKHRTIIRELKHGDRVTAVEGIE